MKLKITTFWLAMALFCQINAQTTTDSIKAIYDSLPSYLYPTHLLHNRSPLYENSFTIDTARMWQVNSDYTASPYIYPGAIPSLVIRKQQFGWLFNDMWHSSTHPALITEASIYRIRDSIARLSYEVPVAALHLNYNRILPGAIDSGYLHFDTTLQKLTLMPDTLWFDKANNLYHYTANPDSVAQLAMAQYEVFAGALTTHALYKQGTQFDVTFGLASALFTENQIDQITYSEMDFDNGQGFQEVYFDVPKIVNYNTTSGESHERILRLRLRYGQKVVETRMPLVIVPNVKKADTTFYVNNLPYTCPIPTGGFSPKNSMVSIRYGNTANKLLKPVIICEGFESAKKKYGYNTWESISSGKIFNDDGERILEQATLLRNAFDSLTTLGYDIIYIDNEDHQDYVQANGLNAIKVIQWANSELAITGSYEKLVVIGASMGGLVARYALSKMEADGCCHNTRLFTSFDSPHNGANIPLGIQHSVRHLNDALAFIDEVLFNSEKVKPNWDALNSRAARQMLVAHIEPDAAAYRNAFVAEFDSLGQPKQCRIIALINGSESALANTITTTNKVYVDATMPLPLPFFHFYGINWAPFANIIGIPGLFNLFEMAAYAEANGTVFDANNPHAARKLSKTILITHGVSAFSQVVLKSLSFILLPCGPCFLVPIPPIQLATNITLPALHLSNVLSSAIAPSQYTAIAGFPNYSESPGSLNNNPSLIAKSLNSFGFKLAKAHVENDHFIPSVSALDIDTNDLYLKIKDFRIPMLFSGQIPFDSYWAPGRGDVPDENMLHIQVTKENYTWLIEQIDLNDQLRHPQTGAYSKTLNGYYNFGRPADFEKPFLKHLYSVNIVNGGNLHINGNGSIGYIGGAYIAVSGSNFKCYTGQNCENPYVRVQNGGLFEVGENLNNSKGQMYFRVGSTLEIEAGGVLRINDNSSLVLEAGAELIIHPGAVIELNGTNAVLDLQGKVVLEQNANFTFTGGGFVRFNQKNIDAGSASLFWEYKGNNTIHLEGNGKFDKVAEITAGMHFSRPQLGLDSVTIKDGLVEFPEFVRVTAYGPIRVEGARFAGADTSTNASNAQFKGLRVYGQTGVNISHTDFRKGKFGLVQFSGIMGNTPLNLEYCTFYNCNTGLLTDGGAANLEHCVFSEGIIGWHAKNMTGSSTAKHSRFKNYTSSSNLASGIKIVGQSSSSLTLHTCYVHNNSVGVHSTSTAFRATCSHIYSNQYYGIRSVRSSVDLKENASNKIINNDIGIGLSDSKLLSLNEGNNDLNSNTSWDVWGTILSGELPISPTGVPYLEVLKNDFTQTAPISIALTESNNTVVAVSNINTQNVDPYYYCPLGVGNGGNGGISGKKLNGSTYYNGQFLHQAVEDNLARMHTNEEGGQSTEILNRWDDVLSFSYPTLSNVDSTLLEIAYVYLQQAMANAYALGALEPVQGLENESVNVFFGMALLHNQRFINNQSTANDADKEKHFRYNLDRAQLYRLGQHYDYALSKLQQSSSYTYTTNQMGNVAYWSCVCTTEQAWFLEEIDAEQYLLDLQECSSLYAAKTGNNSFIGNSPILENETALLVRKLYPNPSGGMLIIEFSEMEKQVDIEIRSVTGVLVYQATVKEEQRFSLPEANWPNGNYFITVNNGANTETLPWVLMR